jgi:hypothetical protein
MHECGWPKVSSPAASDAASQVTKETSTSLGATRTFTNDTVGRVTKENTAVYAYDNADELTTNGAATQGYDAGGQLSTAGTTPSQTARIDGSRRRMCRYRRHGVLLSLLQKNVLDQHTWATRDQLCLAIVHWTEVRYHRRRRQRRLGKLTPISTRPS